MRSFFTPTLLLLLAVSGNGLASNANMNLEQSVCGFKEPLIFWLWSNQAGRPDKGRLLGMENIEDILFRTSDGRILRGYRLNATGGGAPAAAKGYLLVLQGNAMLADQIIPAFKDYADAGYDVYLYDSRGYGRSEGRRRLKAIVSDYQEIIQQLANKPYRQRLVYAMSFGGIVLMDGWLENSAFDRIVVDSSPSRLSGYGCPPAYDPVSHLPADCSRFMFITGMKDTVVTPAMSDEMSTVAGERGANVLRDDAFAHPFMDRDPSAHRRRFHSIRHFLLQQER